MFLSMCKRCVHWFRFAVKTADNRVSDGGPVHVRVPIHAHPLISPKQSQLHNKLPMCMINLIIIMLW